MRLRNIPRAEGVLEACKEVVKNPAGQKSRWHELFQNQNPVHIEIGMGKGQFLLTLPNGIRISIHRHRTVLQRFAAGSGKVPASFRKPQGSSFQYSFSSAWTQEICRKSLPRARLKKSISTFPIPGQKPDMQEGASLPGSFSVFMPKYCLPAEQWNSKQTTVLFLTSPKKRYRNPPSSLWTA